MPPVIESVSCALFFSFFFIAQRTLPLQSKELSNCKRLTRWLATSGSANYARTSSFTSKITSSRRYFIIWRLFKEKLPQKCSASIVNINVLPRFTSCFLSLSLSSSFSIWKQSFFLFYPRFVFPFLGICHPNVTYASTVFLFGYAAFRARKVHDNFIVPSSYALSVARCSNLSKQNPEIQRWQAMVEEREATEKRRRSDGERKKRESSQRY